MPRLITLLVLLAARKLQDYITTMLVASMIDDMSLLLLPPKAFSFSKVCGHSRLHYYCPGVSVNQFCQAVDCCFLPMSTP